VKKSVGFNLEQNTVKEFDKTKRIIEDEKQDTVVGDGV